ncbi:MAG: tetratricopeptide repeat protein [Planctomycetota bacterium]
MTVPALPADAPERGAQAKTIVASAAGYDAGAVFDSDAELEAMSSDNITAPPPAAPPARAATRKIDRSQIAAASDSPNAQGAQSKKGTTRRMRKDDASPPARPMVNRAPTTDDADQFSRKRTAEESTAPPRRSNEGPSTAVRTRAQVTARREKDSSPRGGTRRIQQPAARATNTPMIVGAVAGGVLILMLLVVMMSGGNTPAKANNTGEAAAGGPEDGASNGGNAAPSADRVKQRREQFDADWKGATDVHRKMDVVGHWAEELKTYPTLEGDWQPRYDSALREARGDLPRNDDRLQARELVTIGQWAMRCGKDDDGRRAFREALDLDPSNTSAQAGLGYKKYEKPNTDEFNEMEIESLVTELDPYQGKWLSPDEYADVKAIEGRVMEAAREQMAEWKNDPFARMAHNSVLTLRNNTFFDAYEFETFVARPFVVVQTRPRGSAGNSGARSWDARRDEMNGLLKAVWREWLAVREKWQLKSSRASEGDNLENPIPFVWVAFHNQQAYDEYQQKAQRALPPGARAFYDAKTRMVMFWEEPGKDTADVVIHETFHQLMDRFSEIPPTQYQNHTFTEGAPEFYAGYTGSGASLRLGQFSRDDRVQSIQVIRTWFDAKKGVIWPGTNDQITPDDWIFFDVPMLMALRDIIWVRNASQQMAQLFAQTPYVRRGMCRNLIGRGEVTFHSQFYAYAWAFTYWLNQEYPEQYTRFARVIMNTDRGGDAEVFMEAFNIRPVRPLPNIVQFCGEGNKLLSQGNNAQAAFQALTQRVAILRATPAVQDMHRRWAAWMSEKFPKLPNGPKDGDIGLWQPRSERHVDRDETIAVPAAGSADRLLAAIRKLGLH